MGDHFFASRRKQRLSEDAPFARNLAPIAFIVVRIAGLPKREAETT